MPQGTIQRIVVTRGFGFLQPATGGPDVFFHHRTVVGSPFEELEAGDYVAYELAPEPPISSGADASTGAGPRAAMVRLIPAAAFDVGDPRPLSRHPRSRAKKPGWRR